MPEFISVTYEQVLRHWEQWLVYRSFGTRDMGGGFHPSISYLEAIDKMGDEQLNVFLALDDVYGRMERQYIKQTAGKNG